MIKEGSITLTEKQSEALSLIKRGNILAGGVGSGKTFTSIFWYKRSFWPDKELIVITTAANRDMKKDNGKSDWANSIEAVGITDYTIDSWNNIEKYKNIQNACFLFDEQKTLTYGKWSRTFIKIARNPFNEWILLSATPGDNPEKLRAVFMANNFYRLKGDFDREFIVYNPHVKFPMVQRYINMRKFDELRASILIPMGDLRKTERHRTWIKCAFDVDSYNEVIKNRFNYEENRPIKNAPEMMQLLRRTVNINPTRISKLKELVNMFDKIIIFYNYTYERDAIFEHIQTDHTKAEWNGINHNPIPQTDKWLYIVQYNAAEGWNCIETDVMIFFSLNYSYSITEQAEGRIDRMNTPFKDLRYYYLYSDSLVDKSIMESLQEKKKFTEKGFLDAEYRITFEKGE